MGAWYSNVGGLRTILVSSAVAYVPAWLVPTTIGKSASTELETPTAPDQIIGDGHRHGAQATIGKGTQQQQGVSGVQQDAG